MGLKLVVTSDFHDHPKGTEITDPEEITKVLAGHQESHVVKVMVPDAAPEPEKTITTTTIKP